MKTYAAILAGAILAVAQDLSGIPPCGQTCINNMIQIASTEFGCGAGNATCYCNDPRFGYGLRDCSIEACGAAVQSQVLSYGLAYCSTAGVAPTGGAASVVSSASSTAASGASSTPFTTSAIVSGSSTIGSTTLFTAVGSAESSAASSASSAISKASGAAANASSSAASVAANASSVISSVKSSASGATSKSSSASGGSSSASGGASSSSSSGVAAFITAAPIVGAGAIAAAFLGL